MIIPLLNTETKSQVGEVVRFDAASSLLVKGSVNPINSVQIKPGRDAAFIEVYSAAKASWFLDWAFSAYAFDTDAGLDEVSFEVEGVTYTTQVVPGTYTLDSLLAAIKLAIETELPTLTITFSVDSSNRVSFTTSTPAKLLPKYTSSDLLHHLGFSNKDQTTGAPVEYGMRRVVLSVASISETVIAHKHVAIYTKEGDALFSEDAELVALESDIMKWLPVGKSSFNYLHRKSQDLILDWLDKQGYRDDNGAKLTKWAVVDNSDVKQWSIYQVLHLFFAGAQNASEDVFKEKSKYYEALEISARSRAIISLDLDGDKEAEVNAGPDIGSGRLYLR